MDKSLAIVLPVYNAETHLPAQVEQLLEAAAELSRRISLVIVDDGSTDDTYETASVLAARYPQVTALRQSRRRGLSEALRAARRLVSADVTMLHDGASPVDANQLRAVWRRAARHEQTGAQRIDAAQGNLLGEELSDLAAAHDELAAVHARVAGFRLCDPAGEREAEQALPRKTTASTTTSATHRPHAVGSIPQLPRPNILAALADFALGE